MVAAMQPAIPVARLASPQLAGVQPNPQPIGAHPQFLSPGGVAAQAPDPFDGGAANAAQRLPAGGIPADSAYIR
jgi:hypothetical protein